MKLQERNNLTHCIEIGPGKGAITKLIQPIFHDMFWAIEKDTTFQPILEELVPQHQLIFNDVLEVDLHSLPIDLDSTLVYGSLPYYITSPIISKVFLPPTNKQEARSSGKHQTSSNTQTPSRPQVGIFIVQKEFAEKVAVNATKKSYLRRLLNHSHTVTYHKTIPAKGFSPAPKVDSAIISITKSETQLVNYHNMLLVLDKISGFKRKTIGKIIKIIGNNLKQPTTTGKNLQQLETILPKRLEELSRGEMNDLVHFLFNSII